MEAARLGGSIERLRGELRALDRAYSPGHHGLWSARRRAELLDGALTEMFGAAESPPGVGLSAIGGYGREQQLPRSDLDLLIVHDGRSPEEVAALAERLLYPLWDGGFEVGHAVRTPIECEQVAREHLDALTSMLDLRPVAGDRAIAGEAADRVRAVAAGDVAAFARALREDALVRAERFGVTAHLLEPDLKNGAGGLRDVQAVRWTTAVAGDALLRTAERERIDAAEEFLTRVRSALQFESGTHGDRLPLELQPPVARSMGFGDEPRLIAEDGLMRAVFEHARAVRWIAENVLARAAGGASMPTGTPEPFTGPNEALEALATVAESGDRPDARLLDSLEVTPIADTVAWTDRTRGAFMRILRSGEAGVAALDALDRLGVMGTLMPAWGDVRYRPQRDPYHRFTVDTHLTTTLVEMGRLIAGRDEDPLTAGALAHGADHDGLLLGALLHDIGKTGEGGHVPAGVRIATETLDHMGAPLPTRDLAAFMVAEHLLLPDTATRRDLTDENLILDVAARIGSPEHLAALTLLAKADAIATGPSAWTPWRQTLLRELVTRVQRVFERGHMGAELAQQLTERIDAVRDLLEAEPDDVVERFVLRMPRGYFLSVEPERVAAHYPTIAPDVGSTEVRANARPGMKPGTYELLVVAADRPGLLSWIAGAVALAGLSILTAQAFTTDDGVAVDVFEVEGVFEDEVDDARWREFRGVLRKAVEGRLSLDHLVAKRRARYPGPRSHAPITVSVDNEASDYSTVVEVGAPDRIGLLYDITSALAELTLDVHLAKVATYTDRVIDSFYVRDTLGRKVTDARQVGEIGSVVRDRLTG
ncbi:MAG TPA: ACT domain-containing protein [Actinomycetota bacterium]|nr:ACT domain-containing protein [Actinomycetota bacterium]